MFIGISKKVQKVLLTGEATQHKKFRKIYYNETTNFVLETLAIAQLILIKTYKNTFVQNWYLILFWCPKG